MSHWLITPKVSSGLAPSRCQRNFSVSTVSASAKAVSTSPQVNTRWKMTLVPCSSKIAGLSAAPSSASDHRRQRIVLDDDALERVLGDVAADGGDGGDRFADEAHLVGRQTVRTPAVGHRRDRLASSARVLAGHDREHARQASRRRWCRSRRCARARAGCAGSRSGACREARVVDELGLAGEQLRDPRRARPPCR